MGKKTRLGTSKFLKSDPELFGKKPIERAREINKTKMRKSGRAQKRKEEKV